MLNDKLSQNGHYVSPILPLCQHEICLYRSRVCDYACWVVFIVFCVLLWLEFGTIIVVNIFVAKAESVKPTITEAWRIRPTGDYTLEIFKTYIQCKQLPYQTATTFALQTFQLTAQRLRTSSHTLYSTPHLRPMQTDFPCRYVCSLSRISHVPPHRRMLQTCPTDSCDAYSQPIQNQ